MAPVCGAAMIDHKKLAVVHIVRKELGLGEKEYRDALEKVTGVRSARELDDDSFRRLMRFFARSRHYRERTDGITFRQKMFIRHLAVDLSWDEAHFRNFLKKYYRSEKVEALSKKEASKVIESLKHILAAKGPAGPATSAGAAGPEKGETP
jgi:hypothetical protein